MKLICCGVLALLVIACAGHRPPATFLQTESGPWNEWMNTVVSVDITNVPLAALSTRSPFQGMKMTLTDLDPEYAIALQVEHVPRRQALWMLARKYGLSMNVGRDVHSQPSFIQITPQQLRRENAPRN